MPDAPKLSQADFASKIRDKYNAYQDIDDSTLVSRFLEKYPVYADRVDVQSAAQPVKIEGTQSKLKEAISKDRNNLSTFLDLAIPNDLVPGFNMARSAYKIASGLAVGGINSVESLLKYGAESVATDVIPAIVGVAATLKTGKPVKIEKPSIESVKKYRESVNLESIKPTTKYKSKFDITDGLGIEDLKALPEIAGRVMVDIPLGIATGGSTYYMQGYSDAVGEYDKMVETTGQPSDDNARSFYGVASGAINSVLEQFAINKIFKGPAFNKVKSKIFADVLKRTSVYEGKLGVDAIEKLVEIETKRAMSTLKNRGVKALYAMGVEGGTEGLQTGLQEGSKFISNAIQGKELFNEEDIKKNLFSNIINSAAVGSIMGGVIGGGASLMADTNNEILNSIAETKTPEESEILIKDLDQVFNDENFSPQEREMATAQARKYAEIKQTIPNNIPASAQNQAIRLIESRNEIDDYIKTKEEEIKSMDEAVAGEELRNLELFKDARNSFNDRVRDVVAGEKTKYYEVDGKHYKQIGENAPEQISKNRFEFEQTYEETTPQGPSETEQVKPKIIESKFNKPINQELLETIPKKDISDVVENIDNGNAELNIDVFPATDLGTDNKITNNQIVYLLHSQGKEIGILTVNNETLGNRNESSIAGVVLHPDVKGKGIGKEIYRFVNNDLINKGKPPLKSDFDITPDAINVWKSLVKSGEATQVGIAENGNPLFEMNKPTNVKETEGQQAPPTNETDNSNLPIGSETQQEVNVPTKGIKNKIVLFLQKQLNPFGVLGRTLTSLKEKLPGYISAEMKKADIYTVQALKLINKYKANISPEDIDAFLTGKELSKPLPEDLANQLSKLREHIDGMTESMIDLGIITDITEIENFRNNKGSYLTRAYALFNATGVTIDNITKKLKNVDQTIVDNALNYLATVIYNQSTQGDLFVDNKTLTKEEAMDMAKLMANKILADEENPFTKKKLEGSLNVKALTERQDIAAPLRALMGEYTDPLHKYAITVFKMANLISSQKYMVELRNLGLGKFLFREGDPNAPKEATSLLAAEGSESMAPLAGLYTFPELKEALEQSEKEKTLWITKLAGTVRGFKTVYNPMTHVKNVLGNIGFLVSNAHWSEGKESFELVKELVRGKDNQKLNDLIFKLNELGVLNNTVGIGELNAYFDKHSSLDELIDNIYNKQDSRIKRFAKSSWSAIKTGPQVAYQMEDDIFKIIAYVNESNRYSRALYNKSYTNLSEEEKLNIDKITSEIVKNTYPTFSRVPKGIKNLSKVMFVGNFLAFPAESVRVSYESLKLAQNEINSGNKTLKNIGYKRLAGMIAYNSAVSGLVYYGALMAGVGLSGMAGYLFDEEDKRKKSKSRRMYAASWTKDKDPYVYQFKDGKLIYVDMGGSDPYGYQKEVWNSFWNNLGDNKGFWTSMTMALAKGAQPFTEMDMTVKALLNLAYNEDEYGRKIIKESDNVAIRGVKTLEYLNKTIAPGVLTTAVRMYDAYNEDKTKFTAEAASLSGYRVYTVDLLKQFGIMLNSKNKSVINPKQAFKDRITNDYIKSWNAVKFGNDTKDEKEAEYQRLSNGVRDVLKEMREYYDAAIDGGVPKSQLDLVLQKSGMSRGHIVSVVNNKFDYPNSYYLRR